MATVAENILSALEDTILKLSSGTNQSVNFNGQSFTKKDLKSLTEMRAYWKAEVLREQSLNSDTANRDGRIRIAFTGNNQPLPRCEP